MPDTKQRIIALLNDFVARQGHGPIDLSRTRLLEALNLDSLDRVELLMAVEEEFGIEIHDAEVDQISTIDDLVRIVDGKVGS